jgi:phage shock protein A
VSAVLSQDTLDKLRVQLSQHEAAVKTLRGAMSAMQSKMEDARLQMPALKVSVLHRQPVVDHIGGHGVDFA